MDAALVRVRAERPDSVIGVLIRAKDRVGADERAALDSVGLVIGSVVGHIVTGRIRADAAAALVDLPFVEYVELARMIPSPPRPVVPIDTGRSDERAEPDRP